MKQKLNAIGLILIIIILFILSGCGSKALEDSIEKKVIPVKVLTIENETRSRILSYVGHIRAKEMKKLSFKTGGEIKEIFVKEGDIVKEGDFLASLDTNVLEFGVKAAKAGKDAAWSAYNDVLKKIPDKDIKKARENLEKAINDFNIVSEKFEEIKNLYEKDSEVKSDYEIISIEYDLKKSESYNAENVLYDLISEYPNNEIKALKAQYEEVKAQYENLKNQIDSGKMQSDIDGIIVSVLSVKGEIVGAGYPVIITRSMDSILVVGITQSDIDNIEKGVVVEADINGVLISGEINRIDETPDNASRTYNIDIAFKDQGYRIGTIAKVDIPVGEMQGIWIPITAVLTNGEDFVYIIQNDKAIRKIIRPIDYIESYVRVDGLDAGDVLIVEGIGIVKENDIVKVIEE